VKENCVKFNFYVLSKNFCGGDEGKISSSLNLIGDNLKIISFKQIKIREKEGEVARKKK
jgi:hypothetical protein